MAVTNNIREIREQRGIYQDDLAAAIGYSTKTVGRIERGDSTPSAEFMLRISKYFNMLVLSLSRPDDIRLLRFIVLNFICGVFIIHTISPVDQPHKIHNYNIVQSIPCHG